MPVSAPASLPGVTTTATFCLAQLLPTGGVLCHFSDASNYIFEPDQFGNYANGAARRIADSPFSHLFGSVTVADNGHVTLWGGELGTSHAGASRGVFNPYTETWTNGGTQVASEHRMISVRADGSNYILPQFEDAMVLQPDNTLLRHISEAPGGGGATLQRIAVGGSTTTITPTFPANNYLTAGTPRWTSSFPMVSYEPGVIAYMPRLGRNAVVSGMGRIFLHNPADDTLTSPCDIGIWSGGDSIGTVAAVHNGQTASQIITGGSLSIVVGAFPDFAASIINAANKFIWVRLGGNTSCKGFTYTGGSFSAGVMTLTGLGNVGSSASVAFATGDVAVGGQPFFSVIDGPATVLRNGDLLFAAGVPVDATGNSGFNRQAQLFTWGGTSAPPVAIGSIGDTGTPDFGTQLIPLPDGKVFVKRRQHTGPGPTFAQQYASYQIYTPTTAEAISHHRPTITSLPPVVQPGQTVTMQGTQLNGLHEGGYFGDDGTSRTNFPIVTLTNQNDGRVFFAPTTSYSYRGIAPGQSSSCSVIMPSNLPIGNYLARAISSGNQSDPVGVSVSTAGEIIYMDSYR
jgi:hypothetical protein